MRLGLTRTTYSSNRMGLVLHPTLAQSLCAKSGTESSEWPLVIPEVPTGKPDFGAPNCPVRALRYYRRYLTEHPGLRKDRRRLLP